MKIQTPLDSHIQNCLVIPWHEQWGSLHNDPYFGRITTSPNSNGDFTRDGVDLNDLVLRGKTNFEKQVWFKESDGGCKFILEIPGFGREHLSVEIEGDTLVVKAEKSIGENVGHCFTERYVIPGDQILDLGMGSVKVEHGILTIFFPVLSLPKPQSIKLL
jgi:HSP20 family molecular chaperone IbpA